MSTQIIAASSAGIIRLASGGWEVIDSHIGSIPSERWAGILDLSSKPAIATLPAEPDTLFEPVNPGNFYLVGLNYTTHAEEVGVAVPTELMFSPISAAAVTRSGSAVRLPDEDLEEVDFEAELAIIIGKPAHQVCVEDAYGVIAGVTGCIDISARGVLMEALACGNSGPTIEQSKSFPGFKPLGPAVLVAGEDTWRALDLRIATRINGEVRQNDRTSSMVFNIAQVVSEISKAHRLEAGDVISTGTPAGVGYVTSTYLKEGDLIEVEIGDLPVLTARICR